MKKAKKQGFTLIELMVVVIIVGILAAVAVPLMSANKEKAVGSEATAGLGAINTAAKLYYVGTSTSPTAMGDLTGAGYFNLADLDGTYFNNAGYSITSFGSIGSQADGVTAAAITAEDGKVFNFSWNATTRQYDVK